MKSWRQALTYNVIILSLASLLNDVSSEMIIPLLPFFFLSLQANVLVIGLVEGVAEAVVSGVRVLSGHRSDETGLRKRFISAGYGLSAAAKGLLAFATVWPHILAARVGDRLGKGVRDPSRDALIADSAPPESRGTAFGFHRAMDTTGAVIGPIVAFAFIAAGVAVNTVFLVAAIPAIGAFAITLLVRERRRAPERRPLFGSLASLPAPLRRYLVVAALFSTGNMAVSLVLLRGCTLSLGANACDTVEGIPLTIALYVAFNVVYAILSLAAGRLSDRVGRRPMVLAGYAAVGMVLALFAVTGLPLLVLFLLLGVGYALVDGSQRALVVDLAPAERKGLSLGTYHGISAATRLASGILAGALWVAVSPEAAFFAGGALALSAAALLPWALPTTRTPLPT